MLKSHKEYKRVAIEKLKGNWGPAVIAALLLYGLEVLFIAWEAPFYIITSAPFTIGFAVVLMRLYHAEDEDYFMSYKDLFKWEGKGFTHLSGSLFLYLVKILYMVLWALPYLVPFFIVLSTMDNTKLTTWLLLVALIPLLIPCLLRILCYSFTPFIFVEKPRAKVNDIIRQSVELTRNHRMEIIKIFLSFAGWALLCCATMGIGFLVLFPYLNMTLIGVYEDLKELDRIENPIEESLCYEEPVAE